MATPQPAADGIDAVLEQILGYLNFSSGAPDPVTLANLNRCFQELSCDQTPPTPRWRRTVTALSDHLQRLKPGSETFRDTAQVDRVLHVLPLTLAGYWQFHQDLLYHQADDDTFVNAFFVGRVFEVLLDGGLQGNDDQIVAAAITQLNDYVGHRPVPTLTTHQHEAYAHERIRPVPLYVAGAGVAAGRYQEVVARALELLEDTAEDLREAACFHPQHMEELAIDPRAYDFDHPVNKRPNYHFGQWDPDLIDGRGFYRRMVIQQVTLDALMSRLEQAELPREELVLEAAAVLAGTVLMASGISGWGPGAHQSHVSLATLLPRVAQYRDQFYARLLRQIKGAHQQRLLQEAQARRQPFGGARQHLNAELSRRRATQMEHVHLAKLFAQMGFVDAAQQQLADIPVVSARLQTRIDCLLVDAERLTERGELAAAFANLPQAMELIRRAISCGAMIDPWTILGFDAQFSLFPALENSIHDHRADELVELMDRLFACHSRLWNAATTAGEEALCESIDRHFRETADWWRQFAIHEVSNVDCSDARETYAAARHVAEAMKLWQAGETSSGAIAFWASHVEMFDSPQAYALVIEALLQRNDTVAAMALLIHWLGRAEEMALEEAEVSFFELTQRWLNVHSQLAWYGPAGLGPRGLGEPIRVPQTTDGAPFDVAASRDGWLTLCKFLDRLEANAGVYWETPDFQLREPQPETGDEPGEDEPAFDDEFGLFKDLAYTDTTHDGVEGNIFETDSGPEDEFLSESQRLLARLSFHACVARLWRAAVVWAGELSNHGGWSAEASQTCQRAMDSWNRVAQCRRVEIKRLLHQVWQYPLRLLSADHQAMVDYDRRRLMKESLLDRIIAVNVDVSEAAHWLETGVRVMGALQQTPPAQDDAGSPPDNPQSSSEQTPSGQADAGAQSREDRLTSEILAALLQHDWDQVRAHWGEFVEELQALPLLYVPLGRGGDPAKIVAARVRQQRIQDLLARLPRAGLLYETCELLEVARKMERDNPVSPSAVTEYDELFASGLRAIVDQLISAAEHWGGSPERDAAAPQLVSCLEKLTEATLIVSWLKHSRTLRLSVLEKVDDEAAWEDLVDFIQTYGGEIFSQRFLSLANIRAILHQGVDVWLGQYNPAADEEHLAERLIADLEEEEVDFDGVSELLTLILESIVENYGEYRDYNSTTTQSDDGAMLYTLLDFLRLRSRYDRLMWKLKPINLTHERLVRRGHSEAARLWRRALNERIQPAADRYVQRLESLQAKYAMKLPTIADRLGERFVRSLTIDRICALVRPAMMEAARGGPCPVFELLQEETSALAQDPTGAGLDLPVWLQALEEEVDQLRRPFLDRWDVFQSPHASPQVLLSQEEVDAQLERWSRTAADQDDEST